MEETAFAAVVVCRLVLSGCEEIATTAVYLPVEGEDARGRLEAARPIGVRRTLSVTLLAPDEVDEVLDLSTRTDAWVAITALDEGVRSWMGGAYSCNVCF